MILAERFLAPALSASFVTLGLFWLMQHLLMIEEVPLDPVPPFSIISFVRVIETPPPIETRNRMPKIQQPVLAPPLPQLTKAHSEGTRGSLVPIEPIDPADDQAEGRLHPLSPGSDVEAVPIVRVTPRYPARALARGITGRVLVEFTITTTGSVANARVVASEPDSVFDAAALKAVTQWKYNPRIVKGRAVEQPGIRISIPFRQESDDS